MAALGCSGGAVQHLTMSSLVDLPLRPPLECPEPNSELAGFQEPAVWKMRAVGTFVLQKFQEEKRAPVGFRSPFPSGPRWCAWGPATTGRVVFASLLTSLLHRGPAARRPVWSQCLPCQLCWAFRVPPGRGRAWLQSQCTHLLRSPSLRLLV